MKVQAENKRVKAKEVENPFYNDDEEEEEEEGEEESDKDARW